MGEGGCVCVRAPAVSGGADGATEEAGRSGSTKNPLERVGCSLALASPSLFPARTPHTRPPSRTMTPHFQQRRHRSFTQEVRDEEAEGGRGRGGEGERRRQR